VTAPPRGGRRLADPRASPSATGGRRLARLRALNVGVGLVHLAQAVLMLVLASDLALPVTGTFLAGDPVATGAGGRPEVLFEVRIAWAVAAFLLLAAVDHLAVAMPRVVGWYEANLGRGVNYARWTEYSVSASLMLVLIAMFTGIWDIAALIGIVGANTAMIWFGLLMERHQQPGRADWTAFTLGSVAGLVPWLAIGVYLASAATPPGFVYAIFVLQFLFFMSFGLNQYLQYRQAGRWRSYLFGERAYIWLSLGAKSLLAWLIYANVLRS
jgi:hypothetical protein